VRSLPSPLPSLAPGTVGAHDRPPPPAVRAYVLIHADGLFVDAVDELITVYGNRRCELEDAATWWVRRMLVLPSDHFEATLALRVVYKALDVIGFGSPRPQPVMDGASSPNEIRRSRHR
jgi:hypothetical protein